MIDEREAHGRVGDWCRENGMDVSSRKLFKEFADGWLVSFPPPGPYIQIGAVRVIVDRADGSVHSFPASRSPETTMREYSQRKREEASP